MSVPFVEHDVGLGGGSGGGSAPVRPRKGGGKGFWVCKITRLGGGIAEKPVNMGVWGGFGRREVG